MVFELVDFLQPASRERLRVKPYRNLGWNTGRRIGDRIGPGKVFGKASFYHVLSQSRLVICTYPQTTFAESLASRVPVILMYPRSLWETSAPFAALVERLMRVNIVFESGKAAAAHVNSVWDEPNRWWRSPDVMTARAELERMTMKTGANWLERWKVFVEGVTA